MTPPSRPDMRSISAVFDTIPGAMTRVQFLGERDDLDNTLT